MAFNATYFDGNSSKSHSVEIYPNYSSWRISFSDSILPKQDINWQVNDIKKSEVYTKDIVVFTYGKDFPFQRIESADIDFIDYINNSNNDLLSTKVDVVLHKSVGRSILILVFAIIAFAIGMYFYVIPTIAVGFAKNLPSKSVISFGDYVYRTLSPTLTIDNKQSEKLQDFVDALTIQSEFPIDIKVATSDDLNAFALSGGKIVVFSSLLEKIQNENQLAALIGHEISHIENRHVLKSVSRNLSSAIFISIIFGDVNGVTAILGENAHLFSQLSYSRSLEKEADIFGLELLRNNNLDLHGMPELFQILKDESLVDIPAYLSNHPILQDRIQYTSEIAETQKSFTENTLLKEKWVLLKKELQQNIEEQKTEIDE